MNTPNISRTSSPRLHTRTMAMTALMLAFLGGCRKHADGDGHDHGSKTPAKADDHTGHDHGTDGGGHKHEGEQHADEVRLTAEAIERYGVRIQPARLTVLQPTFTAPARVSFNAEAMAHVGSPLRGRVVEIRVRQGDAVKRGDTLLVIESPELGEAQNDFFQKRIAAQTAAPAVELAKVAWERGRGLLDQSQGISLTEVQRREAEYKAMTAAQRAAEAAVVGAENRLRLLGMSQAALNALAESGVIAPRCAVHAPIDGQVLQRDVTLGELVNPDREALIMLADTSVLWVLVDVPEARLHEVAVNARAWVTLGTAGARRDEGRVTFVAPLVDAATRTAQVRIDLPAAMEGAPTLKPGMFAQVEIVATALSGLAGPEPAPMVAVPDEAVQTVEGGPAVFVPVLGEVNTFAKRAVKIGPAVGGMVPVFGGLAEGEEFVAAGTFILKAELGKGSAAHEH